MDGLAPWIDREWLITNGLGGFMATTPAGANTRRYHGLFVAALHPPVDRQVLLSKCEEQLIDGQDVWELSTNEYSGAVHPKGYQWLKSFSIDPLPKATYQIGAIRLTKQCALVHGKQIAQIHYRMESCPRPVILEIRPLVAGRDYHHLLQESPRHVKWMAHTGNSVSLLLGQDVPLHLDGGAFAFESQPDWYRNFHYRVEAYRGQDREEDLFCPGVFRGTLAEGESWTLTASLEKIEPPVFETTVTDEVERRRALVPVDWDGDSARLAVAADSFVVRRGQSGYTVLAGYPWFTDWGRDTMIALPGLTLVTGRYDIARGILGTFASHCSEGMLPNRFPDTGEEPHYNTVDGTLWFFWAVQKYLDYTDDWQFVEKLWPTLEGIIQWHVRGTRYGIRMDEDGLLLAGDEGTQLTWMDAKVGDWVVTPRHGKPVEVNALWYNALRVCQHLASRLGDADHYRAIAERTLKSFADTFWNPETHCLYDTVTADFHDASVRPNQLLAASLPHPLVSRSRAKQIVRRVQEELWTPMGLRSLSPRDSRYVGEYGGDAHSRDGSYHQGTVWAWPIGPFITAMMYAHGRSDATRKRARRLVQGLLDHLDTAGLGSVSEIADGDSPHTPRGCFAQAWSVAELLRVLREDLTECSGNQD